MKAENRKILIYCDGACSGNQFDSNMGGWGAVLKYGEQSKTIFGGELNTTNQRMELMACIRALELVKVSTIPIEVYSDSAYLVNCINEQWYKRWVTNGWRNSKRDPVENRDLWEKLLDLLGKYQVSFHKVNGHSGVDLNEMADKLARKGAAAAGKS